MEQPSRIGRIKEVKKETKFMPRIGKLISLELLAKRRGIERGSARIKLKVSVPEIGSSFRVNSVLNAGFETEVPEMLAPARVAELLGFWPRLPEETVVKEFETPVGIAKMYYLADAIQVQAITEDRISKNIKCALVISELEREVLLSDMAISELEIVIEDAGRGLWRFKEETKIRNSVEPQYW